jgi:hypothetical protein
MSREFDELLSAYLDGEVSPEERAAVERRLEQSPQLRETLDELSEVGDLIRKLPRARPPIDLPERVVAAISPKPLASAAQPRKSHRLFGAWPMMAAGTVLAAGVAIVVLLPRQPQQSVNGLASNSGGAPASGVADSPAPSLDRNADGMAVLAFEPARRTWNDGGEMSRSLSESVDRLGRTPITGEVLSGIVNDNAGQTHLVRFQVVDSRQVEDKIRTILINNNFNVVETETAVPRGGVAADPAASDGFVAFYAEAPRQQIEQTLDEFGSIAVNGQIEDYGPLGPEPEAAGAALFADTDVKRNSELEPFREKDKATENLPVARPEAQEFRNAAPAPTAAPTPAPAPKEEAPKDRYYDSPPALVATDPTGAPSKAAEPKRLEAAQLGDQIQVETKAGLAGKAVEQIPAQASASRGELEKLSAPLQAPFGNASRAVSAQLDSNSPVVQRARNAIQGNAVVGNAVQGNATQNYSLQRGSLSQTQYSFNRLRGLRPSEEQLGRQLNESLPAEQSDKSGDVKAGTILLKQQNQAGRPAVDGTREFDAAVVANPQNTVVPEEMVRILFIAEQPPQPAAAASPAAKPEAK